jgi:hypothetical protein
MKDFDVGSTEYWRDIRYAQQQKRAGNRAGMEGGDRGILPVSVGNPDDVPTQ